MVKLSKLLSWALRHGAQDLGLNMTPEGYVSLSELLSKHQFSNYTTKQVTEVVETNDKKRFKLTEQAGQLYIRANQGHTINSVSEDKLLREITDFNEFPTVIHGTTKSALTSILKRGLFRMNRNHIHLAAGMPGQVISGARANCNVFIEVNMPLAMQEGIKFYVSDNNVVLTSGVSGFLHPKYFKNLIIDGVHKEPNYNSHLLDLDYILVLDFEANCVRTGRMPCQEIIEFPVQALNCRTLEVEKVFHSYVLPEVVPEISEFCTELTGITQETVKDSPTIEEVLASFDEFLSNFAGTNFAFLTCGDWDLKTCLPKELSYKGIPVPSYFDRWINLKKVMPLGRGMMEALKTLNIEHQGRHHSGIDDVKNITKCVVALVQAGVQIFEDDFSHRV